MLTITGELGRLEEFFSEAIYPVWPLWAAAAIALAVAAGFFAHRRGWHRVALRHPLISGAALAVLLAVAVPSGYYLASPLFERSLACEASPLAGAGAGSEKCEDRVMSPISPAPTASPGAPSPVGPSATPAPSAAPTPGPTFEPRVTHQGEFHGADDFHFGRGKALLIETAPG